MLIWNEMCFLIGPFLHRVMRDNIDFCKVYEGQMQGRDLIWKCDIKLRLKILIYINHDQTLTQWPSKPSENSSL